MILVILLRSGKCHPVDNFGTVVGENPDCLLLSGTVVGENPSWDAQSVLTGVLWDIYPVLKRSKPEKLSEVCKQAMKIRTMSAGHLAFSI